MQFDKLLRFSLCRLLFHFQLQFSYLGVIVISHNFFLFLRRKISPRLFLRDSLGSFQIKIFIDLKLREILFQLEFEKRATSKNFPNSHLIQNSQVGKV